MIRFAPNRAYRAELLGSGDYIAVNYNIAGQVGVVDGCLLDAQWFQLCMCKCKPVRVLPMKL